MNAYELADDVKNISTTIEALEWAQKASSLLIQQADRIAELEHMNKNWQLSETMAYNRIAELEFENKAFRDELFKRGSMDSCSQAAAMHGFVSPRQAGDDAREYITNVLKKASKE